MQAKTLKSNCLKPHKFSITLREDDASSYTYKVDRKLFNFLKKYLEPFRTYQPMSKKIICIETGQIFNSAGEASLWVKFVKEIDYCDMNLIKRCCKDKQETSYGYHWGFTNNIKID